MENIVQKEFISLIVDVMSIKGVTDEVRLEIISHFCNHCGSKDTNCVCMKDE